MARPPLWIQWTPKQNLPLPWEMGWRRTVSNHLFFIGLKKGKYHVHVEPVDNHRRQIALGVTFSLTTAKIIGWKYWTNLGSPDASAH